MKRLYCKVSVMKGGGQGQTSYRFIDGMMIKGK